MINVTLDLWGASNSKGEKANLHGVLERGLWMGLNKFIFRIIYGLDLDLIEVIQSSNNNLIAMDKVFITSVVVIILVSVLAKF